MSTGDLAGDNSDDKISSFFFSSDREDQSFLNYGSFQDSLCSTSRPASPHLEYYFGDTGSNCDTSGEATVVPLHSTPIKSTSACGRCLAHFVCDDSYSEGHFAFDNSSCEDDSCSFIELPESKSMSDESPTSKRRKLQQSEILECIPITDNELNNTVHKHSCCPKNCLADIDQKAMKSFDSKTIIEQNQFLMGSFNLFTDDNSTIQHMIVGKCVCKYAFITYFKISLKRYGRIYEQFRKNPALKITRKPTVRSESIKTTEAKAWMAQYFKRIGDKMPHVDQIHLPHGLTKQDVYQKMKQDLSQQGVLFTISQAHFYAIWKSCFSNVHIPKVSYVYVLESSKLQ